MKISFFNGILAIILGAIILLLPDITIAVLSIYLAIALIIGGLALMIGTRGQKNTMPNWHLFQFEAVISILVGILILIKPVSAAAFFTILIGLWILAMGLILLFTYSKRMPSVFRLTHLIGGTLSLVFGLLILLNPFESMRVIIVLIGLYTIAYGIISIIHTTKKIYRQ